MASQVQYLGFVYIRSGEDGRRMPGLSAVRKASKLLEKPKKAQEVHPLFARGFDTHLNMRVGPDGIVVSVLNEKEEELIVMDHPMHKVSFVVAVKKTVYVVAKHELRGKGIMFKCHGFRTKTKELAASIAKDIAAICNNVFRQLRQTQLFIRNQSRRAPTRGKGSIKTIESETGEVNAVQMRQRTNEDADLRALRNLIAQTRISVIEGKTIEEVQSDVSDEQTQEAEQMLMDHNTEDSTFLEVVKQLQTGINAVNLSDMDLVSMMVEERMDMLKGEDGEGQQDDADDDDDDDDGQTFDIDELDLIDFEDFTDDFARMTLMLHDDYNRGPKLPTYADITLDSDIFNVSWV